MNNTLRYALAWSLLLLIAFHVESQELIDKKATPETKALYQNLKQLSSKGILFGHQESDAYGVGWANQPNQSDVKLVCGSFPAVHGWDVGNEGQENNVDGVKFTEIQKLMNETLISFWS